MSVLEMKKKIEQLNTAITEQQKSLALLRQQIVTASKPFVKERIKHEVEQQVKSNSEHTKELGKDALTEMKRQLMNFGYMLIIKSHRTGIASAKDIIRKN